MPRLTGRIAAAPRRGLGPPLQDRHADRGGRRFLRQAPRRQGLRPRGRRAEGGRLALGGGPRGKRLLRPPPHTLSSSAPKVPADGDVGQYDGGGRGERGARGEGRVVAPRARVAAATIGGRYAPPPGGGGRSVGSASTTPFLPPRGEGGRPREAGRQRRSQHWPILNAGRCRLGRGRGGNRRSRRNQLASSQRFCGASSSKKEGGQQAGR